MAEENEIEEKTESEDSLSVSEDDELDLDEMDEDEIGDDDVDNKEKKKKVSSTSHDVVPSHHNQFGRTSTPPAMESQGQKHHNASAEKEVTYAASSIIRRTASEEFGMRFRAESAGRNGEKLFLKKLFFF